MKRQYAIFNASNGSLIANLNWALVCDIYGGAPDSIRTIYKLRRNGRLQIRWVCTGFDADTRENVQEFNRLDAVRKNNNLPSINETLRA